MGSLRCCSEDVGSFTPSLDSTNAFTVAVYGNLGVAFITPPSVPRVLDDVVAGSVADGSHAVVSFRSAGIGIVDDTFLVVVEDGLTGSNTHGGRSTGDSSFETANREFDHMGLACNLDARAVSLARALFRGVGVLALFLDFVCGSIGVHVSKGSATASLALGVAVKDLLLGELDKLTTLLEPKAFNASNAGESPA